MLSTTKRKSVRFAQENDNSNNTIDSREVEVALNTRGLNRDEQHGATSSGVNNNDSSTTAAFKNREIQKTLRETKAVAQLAKTETSEKLECHTELGRPGNSLDHSDHSAQSNKHTTKQQQRPGGDVTHHISHVMAETNDDWPGDDPAGDVDNWPGANMMTSSSDVKVRYVHLNDRTYSIGGHRAGNTLQWYAVKAADDDVTNRKDQQIVIYQVEGEIRQRQQEQESRVINSGSVSNVEQTDESGTVLVDVDSPDELKRCLDEDTSERQSPTSTGSTRWDVADLDTTGSSEQLHQQRNLSDIKEEEQNGVDCSPTSSTTKIDRREDLQELRDANEHQLIAFSKQVSSLQKESSQYIEQLYSSGDYIAQLEHKLLLQTEQNQESLREIRRLTETQLNQNVELSNLQLTVESLNQLINELQTKNANLLHRAELYAANSLATPRVTECLRPCCLTSSEVSTESSNNNRCSWSLTTTTEPVLHRAVGYHPGKAIDPVRCKSAPVKSSLVPRARGREIYSNNHQQANSKDYFQELFEETSATDEHREITHNLPVGSFVEHSYNTCTASSTGAVRILEVSHEGKYVRLINTSSVLEYEIGGHIVQQSVWGHPVHVFQFPPRVTVPKLAAVTVWSESGKQPKSLSHYLSIEFVYKGCKEWSVGPQFTTVLCRPSGQAIAWYTATSHVTNEAQQSEVVPISNNQPGLRASTTRIDCIRPTRQQTEYYNSQGSYQIDLHDKQTIIDLKQIRSSSPTTRMNGQTCPSQRTVCRPAQRLGSATLRRFTPSRPISAIMLQNT